jgi:hypothetical protein
MTNLSSKTAAIIAIASFFTLTQPAAAQDCVVRSGALEGHGIGLRIARPEGREMCVTIAKSAGLSAGRITVVTVRPVLNASAEEIEVQATKERGQVRGTGAHYRPDLTTPELLSGAQLFLAADDDRHITIRVRPRHARDYRLIINVHEIDIPQVLLTTAGEALAMIAFAELMEAVFGKDMPKVPLLDHRVQSVVAKSFFGTARGHSPEQIVADVSIGLVLKEIMAGQDVPRNARIAVAALLMNAWREISKGATSRIAWSLPDNVRDTSVPLPAATN